MPTFLYRAVDLGTQKPVNGAIDATNDREARAALHARGILPLAVDRSPEDATPEGAALQSFLSTLTYRPVRPHEMMIFVQQFAALLEAGMPLVETMVLLEEQTTHPTLKATIEEVRKDLLSGYMLSEALARHPKVFPPMLVHLSAAGELSGDLGEMIGRMGQMLEKDLELQRKVKGALAYPVVLSATLAAVVMVLLAFVVPAFSGLYGKAGAALPWPTLVLMGLSTAIRVGWPFMLLGGVAAIYVYRWYRQTPEGRPVVDRAWLRLPWIGPVLMHQSANTFMRAFGTVYGAGIPIVPALDCCKRLVSNRAISELIDQAQEGVQSGSPLSEGLARSPYFPRVLAQMMAIGEASGRLEELSAKAVTFSDREVDFQMKQVTNLLEPAMTLIMGLIVMFIAMALYLPLFDLPKILMKT